jgi:flagellar protein FlbD
MIELHRLGQPEPFQLNPDLIVTVEAHPDTVVTLATGTKVVVTESPDGVTDLVRAWRVSITNAAWRSRREDGAALV